MTLALLVAMSQNRVIGHQQALPWHLPHDLCHFRTLTLGHPVIMGRRTHESIGKPLPDRHNIVITSNAHYTAPGCTVVPSFTDALPHIHSSTTAFVIGGARVYAEALPLANIIYLTLIEAVIAGDTYFPVFDNTLWLEQDNQFFARDEKNACDHRFITLVRRT